MLRVVTTTSDEDPEHRASGPTSEDLVPRFPDNVRREIRDSLGLRSPHVTHGAHLVALTSFGTVIAVSIVAASVAATYAANFPVALALLTGVAGGLVGFVLWTRNRHALATFLHTSGLLTAALLCLVGTGTLGGPTSILLLASVITAGGLMGWRAVLLDLLACGLVLIVGWTAAEPLQQLLGMTPNYEVPEPMMVAFVVSSLPSWGFYVVAIDTSNRVAWLRAQASVALLADKARQQATAVDALKLDLALARREAEQSRMLRMLVEDHSRGLPLPALQARCEGALAHWRIPGGLPDATDPESQSPVPGADTVARQDAEFRSGIAALLRRAEQAPDATRGGRQ